MKNSAIAVIGMAGRFPGAGDVDTFWENLRNGVESIQELSEKELLAAGARKDEIDNPDYVRAAAVLENVAMFDAAFFGLSPKDAAIMDPQQRHFLECAWEALENAGHAAQGFEGSIGVYAGSGINSYLIHNLLTNRNLLENTGLFLLKMTGNDKDVLATRVSYHLNLRGPSLSIQTACSTSLVAVHTACQSLLSNECDLALAGGVTIEIPHGRGYLYREGEILSRDGHCRPFDASASGTVFSSGAGVVVLRRLEDAIEDRDTIQAVILGSAVNNDGSRKVGYFAPSVEGQADVIAEALGVANVPAESISYVETHGTGTKVGDPIEIEGLTQAFHNSRSAKNTCALGSLKSNAGHLDAASGVAGLIKCVLALKHGEIPPSLHFETPNPLIDFKTGPFYVNSKLSKWSVNAGVPRRAGVTSLGIGGTNAHVVLEEAPPVEPTGDTREEQLLVLSAKSAKALDQAASHLTNYLERNPGANLADVAFTLQAGRTAFTHRRAAVVRNVSDVSKALSTQSGESVFSGSNAGNAPSIVFLFSGQGSQYWGMGRDLYRTQTVFRDNLDACAEYLRPILGVDLRDVLFSSPEHEKENAKLLNQTWITQPALFSVEYALAQWWMKAGIRPWAMVGHSVGEFVAACLAGVLSLEDALELITVRGRLMQQMPAGSMIAVPLGAEELKISEPLSIAAINAPKQCVVSGPTEAIEALETDLAGRGVVTQRLRTSHAFHSQMMAPVVSQFREHMCGVALNAPSIPFLSNVTGDFITATEATDPEYWVRHLGSTVRFAECLYKLRARPDLALLEVGPGHALAILARQNIGRSAQVFESMRGPQETVSDYAHLLKTVGKLWASGQRLNWNALHAGESVRRIPLPTYPFERQRYWIDPGSDSLPGTSIPVAKADSTSTIERWFQTRTWRQTPLTVAGANAAACCVVFSDAAGLSDEIVKQLRSSGNQVITVIPGESFARTSDEKYQIQASARADYDALLADLEERGRHPQKFIHLWSMRAESTTISLEQALNFSFYSLLFLAQALGDQDLKKIEIAIVSDRLQSVLGETIHEPVRATLLGPAKVILKEFPEMGCRAIDINLGTDRLDRAAAQIIGELSVRTDDAIVAYRGGERWTESLETAPLRRSSSGTRLRQHGTYLITGGTGGIGMVIAKYLVKNFQARLVLLSRTQLPAAHEWKHTLTLADTPTRLKARLRELLELEAMGSQILAIGADVTDFDGMKDAVDFATGKLGMIHGVIHAAGILEDSPILTKTRESASRVLNPKVKGTLVLAELFRGKPLDFLALFSSISSLDPPAGQVDYAAANAFLDAFAMSGAIPSAVAINWGKWRDVGMAAKSAGVAHPLLEQRILATADEQIYVTRLSSTRDWLLDEHRFRGGDALLPGTGYMEMALAAFGPINEGIELRHVSFLAPFSVADGETRDIRLRIRKEGASSRFSVFSEESQGLEFAAGDISRAVNPRPKESNLRALRSRCDGREIRFGREGDTRQKRFIDFGGRWKNLQWIYLGDREALAVLELPPEFTGDLESYLVHPSLFDLATGAALYSIPNYETFEGLYLPVSYRRVSIYGRLPQRIYSHIRSRESNSLRDEVVTFDITIMDENGMPLIDVEQFSLKKINDVARLAQKRIRGASIPSTNGSAPVRAVDPQTIGPEEGAEAFGTVLGAEACREIAVCPFALANAAPRLESKVAALAPDVSAAAEPNTSPDEVRLQLKAIWEDLLGVKPVQLNDNFFDLGGHSLLAARLAAKVRKIWGAELPLATLFQAPTIEKLATVLQGTIASKGSPRVAAIKPEGSLPAFLCVDAGPYFRLLAKRLNPGQPFLGLRLADTSGLPVHFAMSDIAAYHIETIREIQPKGPYFLGGWSASGLVAYEISQQLRSQGEEVALLVLFDVLNTAPPNPPTRWESFRELCGFFAWKIKFHASRLAQMKSKDLGAEFRYLLRRVRLDLSRAFWVVGDMVQRRVSKPLSVAPREASKAVFVAAHEYRPEPYDGNVVLFRSAVQSEGPYRDPRLGWGHLLNGSLEIREMPGDHEDMFREPYVELLAKELDRALLGATERNNPVPAAR